MCSFFHNRVIISNITCLGNDFFAGYEQKMNKNVEIGRSAPVSRSAQVLLGDKKAGMASR
jgi:hypothetical protein